MMMEFMVRSVIRQKCDRCLQPEQVFIQRKSHSPRSDHGEVCWVQTLWENRLSTKASRKRLMAEACLYGL